MKINKAMVIFSGHNERAILSFCRFAKREGLDIYIVANGSDDQIFLTDYSKNVVLSREKNKLTLENLLEFSTKVREITNKEHIFVLPSTEYLNRFLLDNHETLQSNNIEYGLCNAKTYKMISDKHSFGELCTAHGIPIPIEYDAPPSFYPYVIKPRHYRKHIGMLDKPVIINSKDDASRYLGKMSLKEYYFQEFVEGNSIYLLFYFFKNGDYRVYSQENLIQQNNGGSIILAKSANYHFENIAGKFTGLFASLGFQGLVMVEVRLRRGEYYMIEANPRLWGPSQLILDSGMDLFDSFCQDNDLIEIELNVKRNYIEDTWYYWSGGWMADLRNGLKPVYHNFSAIEFTNAYHQAVESEVYLKPDSINIYLREHLK